MARIETLTVDLKVDGRVIQTFEKLVEENKRIRKERDAAVEDLRRLGRMAQNICPVCTHYNHGAGNPEKCPKALKEDCFEWRGVKHG